MSGIQNAVIRASSKNSGYACGMPTSLAMVAGRPLIHWQLDVLENCRNVVVIVGHQAANVMRAVLSKRSDAIFMMDHDAEKTSPLDSLLLGTSTMDEAYIYLEGNVLVDQKAIDAVMESPWPVIGISRTNSEQPVCVDIKENRYGKQVTGFTKEPQDYEWIGLAQLNPESIRDAKGAHEVFHAIEQTLPIAAVEVDCREIRNREDLEESEDWLAERSPLRKAVNA